MFPLNPIQMNTLIIINACSVYMYVCVCVNIIILLYMSENFLPSANSHIFLVRHTDL